MEFRTAICHAVLISVLIHDSSGKYRKKISKNYKSVGGENSTDGGNSTEPKINMKEAIELQKKHAEGMLIASQMMTALCDMWAQCVSTSMPGKSFLVDNVQNYVNYPARTTIGFAPKFTSNRKFFGNLISSTSFKTMLEKDENELRLAFISKMKYCDESIMDQEILKDFYDREVDVSKLRRK